VAAGVVREAVDEGTDDRIAASRRTICSSWLLHQLLVATTTSSPLFADFVCVLLRFPPAQRQPSV